MTRPHESRAVPGLQENAAKLNCMNTNLQLNLFNTSIPQFADWHIRTGLICDRLWRAISDGAPFDPADHRLQELEWAYLFAFCGMTWAAEYPGGKLFRVSYDLPLGPARFIVLATPTSDGDAVVFSLHAGPLSQPMRREPGLSTGRMNRRHRLRELSLIVS